VSGQVVRPGLVRLPPGSRVADAIQAAGGPLAGVDLSGLNLARKLNDGELIAVGIPAPAAGGVAGAPAKINLNTATLAELDTLPGVGPVLAQRIIDHRGKRGPFRSVDDLRQVDGIGEETFARLKDLVVV
jgi:competence protein ComEA